MVQVQYLICIIIVNNFFLHGFFKICCQEILKQQVLILKCFLIPYFVLLLETGKTPKPYVGNWGKKGKQVLTLGCRLFKAKGNSRLAQMMQAKCFDLQDLS